MLKGTILIFLSTMMIVFSCREKESIVPELHPTLTPVFSSYSPKMGLIGDTLKILGKDFDPESRIKKVTFSGKDANIF
ncbi:MAG: hypothetical protein R2804_07995 [Cyclobacteriaceae bacterium]